MKGKCEVKGCGRDQRAKGLCAKHYYRLLSGGDPHTPSCREMTLEERFQAKLAPQDPVTGCIEWTGWRINGYGHFKRGGKTVYAHRLAWELKHGPIPKGKCVCHTCDNPPCCNDEHLYLGTHGDNMADKMAKGRGNQAKGESSGRAKLTEKDVLEIRRCLANGEVQRRIAKDFGITPTAVRHIKTGKLWKHLK